MSQILMRGFFGRREHGCYMAVNMHMIYWMNKPIIELISRFNDPRFHDFKQKWGARRRILLAPSSPYSGIDVITDFRMPTWIHTFNVLKAAQLLPLSSNFWFIGLYKLKMNSKMRMRECLDMATQWCRLLNGRPIHAARYLIFWKSQIYCLEYCVCSWERRGNRCVSNLAKI